MSAYLAELLDTKSKECPYIYYIVCKLIVSLNRQVRLKIFIVKMIIQIIGMYMVTRVWDKINIFEGY